MKYGLLMAAVPLALLGACSQKAAAPAADKDSVLADIHAIQDKAETALNAHDVDTAFSNNAAKQYVIAANQAPTTQTAPPDQLKTFISNKAFMTSTVNGPGFVSDDGSLAVTTNTRSGSGVDQDGKPVKFNINQMIVWQKNGTGEWQSVAVMNGPGAAPAAAAAAAPATK